MLDRFILQLGQELDMVSLIKRLEPNHFQIPLEGDKEIEALQLNQSYLFKSKIGKVPQQNKEAFLLKTMEANLFGKGTRGAAIGLIESENMLTLSLELDYNSSYKDFKEKLDDFVSVLDFWQQEALKHH